MSEISKLEQKYKIKKIDNETVNIQILDNNILLSIIGEFNANLVLLEKLTKTTLFFRGNSITAKGNSDNLFTLSTAIKFLISKFLLTNNIEKIISFFILVPLFFLEIHLSLLFGAVLQSYIFLIVFYIIYKKIFKFLKII